jgi:hypothetical protein
MRLANLAEALHQAVGLHRGHEVASQRRQPDRAQLLRPGIEQRRGLPKVPLLAGPLPARLQPVEALHLGQHLGRRRRRNQRQLGQVLHAEPVLMANQQAVQDLRAPPREQRPHGAGQGLGRRLVDVEVGSPGRQVEAAAAVVVPDALGSKQLLRPRRDGLGDQDRQRLAAALAGGLLTGKVPDPPDELTDVARVDRLPHLDERVDGLPATSSASRASCSGAAARSSSACTSGSDRSAARN